MDRAGILAALVAQAERPPNSAVHDMVTLRAVIEEASEMGAQRALKSVGLSDKDAGEDIEQLRELLGAWRAAKKGAVKSAVEWVVRGLLALLLLGLAVRFGLGELV
ncbi:MAG: hypothetical protein GW859_01165 [Sphingomonadales bacterium]|nr:hypothetical protein [Sphingomonadales bacterium]